MLFCIILAIVAPGVNSLFDLQGHIYLFWNRIFCFCKDALLDYTMCTMFRFIDTFYSDWSVPINKKCTFPQPFGIIMEECLGFTISTVRISILIFVSYRNSHIVSYIDIEISGKSTHIVSYRRYDGISGKNTEI